MKWLSIDPSNNTGLAYWENEKLLYTFTARKVGTKGKWGVEGGDGIKKVYESKWELFVKAFETVEAIIIEEGFGKFASAVKSQSGFREYFHAVSDYLNTIGHKQAFNVVNVSEWRRCIKEEFVISWPATTERKKELSKSLVEKAYGIRVSDDESDAVLLGRAVLRMGMVKYG